MRKYLVVLALVFLLCLPGQALAAEEDALHKATQSAAAYLYKAVPAPTVESVGGEWAVLGLARGSYEVPDSYFAAYFSRVKALVQEKKGVLHERKYTEYSRVVLALTAAGYDARSVGGYDLTLPLADYQQTVWQGVNGAIWALLALDSGAYPIPQNSRAKTQATRQMYVDEILRCQQADGGWNLNSSATAKTDPDITGMALQALAKYQEQTAVQQATAQALTCLSAMQDKTGGYAGWGNSSLESTAQVLVALCELGIAVDDPRFVKNGQNLVDNLLSFQHKSGGFYHIKGDKKVSLMAAEQALYALVAVERAQNEQNSLYRMDDAPKPEATKKPSQRLQ